MPPIVNQIAYIDYSHVQYALNNSLSEIRSQNVTSLLSCDTECCLSINIHYLKIYVMEGTIKWLKLKYYHSCTEQLSYYSRVNFELRWRKAGIAYLKKNNGAIRCFFVVQGIV